MGDDVRRRIRIGGDWEKKNPGSFLKEASTVAENIIKREDWNEYYGAFKEVAMNDAIHQRLSDLGIKDSNYGYNPRLEEYLIIEEALPHPHSMDDKSAQAFSFICTELTKEAYISLVEEHKRRATEAADKVAKWNPKVATTQYEWKASDFAPDQSLESLHCVKVAEIWRDESLLGSILMNKIDSTLVSHVEKDANSERWDAVGFVALENAKEMFEDLVTKGPDIAKHL